MSARSFPPRNIQTAQKHDYGITNMPLLNGTRCGYIGLPKLNVPCTGPARLSCRVPGVVDLCGTADDAQNVYLVFEPCFGGDLYKRLAHRGLYGEAQLCKEVRGPGAWPAQVLGPPTRINQSQCDVLTHEKLDKAYQPCVHTTVLQPTTCITCCAAAWPCRSLSYRVWCHGITSTPLTAVSVRLPFNTIAQGHRRVAMLTCLLSAWLPARWLLHC
jgi:hypothetical protein